MAGIAQDQGQSGWFVASTHSRPAISYLWPADMLDLVRDQLAYSGIAERLPAGLGGLPDLAAAAPGLLRPFLRLGLPRNNRQLARHLAENLKWYLAPTTVAFPWHSWGWVLSLLSIGTTVFLLANWLEICGWLAANAPNQFLTDIAGLIGFIGPLFLIIIGGIAVPLSQFLATKLDKLHAEQLYFYLLEHYADR